MKKTITLMLFLTCVLTTGCEENNSVECPVQQVEELEAIVKGNSLSLIEALEAFAGDNEGFYPSSIDSDTTVTGKVLVDYLPLGRRLLNPFTGLRDQPIDTIPSSPGETGYYKKSFQSWYNVYFVKGFGAESIIVEHDNIAQREMMVIESCLDLQKAVELWHDEAGYYPCNSIDADPSGKTVVDYLPGGILLVNAMHMLRTEPAVWGGSAAQPGEIGYVCVWAEGQTIGYVITGCGTEAGEIICTFHVN